jgi:hypothetical protein
LGIERKLLYSWKWQFEGRPEKNHANYLGRKPEETAEDRLRAENKELKEALGQKAAELDFFAAALRRVKRDLAVIDDAGENRSTPKSGSSSSRKGN